LQRSKKDKSQIPTEENTGFRHSTTSPFWDKPEMGVVSYLSIESFDSCQQQRTEKMGKISYWNPGPGENCTANAITGELSIPIILKHPWCCAILEPNYRITENFIGADYLVLNFGPETTQERLQELAKPFKYILLEVVKYNHDEWQKRNRMIFKFTKTVIDQHRFRECVSYMNNIFSSQRPLPNLSPVNVWGPGKRVLATNADGVNIDPEKHFISKKRYY
jgi:hypothetical protein